MAPRKEQTREGRQETPHPISSIRYSHWDKSEEEVEEGKNKDADEHKEKMKANTRKKKKAAHH